MPKLKNEQMMATAMVMQTAFWLEGWIAPHRGGGLRGAAGAGVASVRPLFARLALRPFAVLPGVSLSWRPDRGSPRRGAPWQRGRLGS